MQQSHKKARQLPTSAVPMRTGNPISKYPGVIWDKSLGQWRASITRNKKTKHLGTFPAHKEMDAAQAYMDAAERHARLKKSDLVG